MQWLQKGANFPTNGGTQNNSGSYDTNKIQTKFLHPIVAEDIARPNGCSMLLTNNNLYFDGGSNKNDKIEERGTWSSPGPAGNGTGGGADQPIICYSNAGGELIPEDNSYIYYL